jgi:hypothetical protein
MICNHLGIFSELLAVFLGVLQLQCAIGVFGDLVRVERWDDPNFKKKS